MLEKVLLLTSGVAGGFLGAQILVKKTAPRLILTPGTAPLNTLITATFHGFPANTQLTGIVFSPTGGAPTTFPMGITDQSGALVVTFNAQLPSTGTWPILAYDIQGNVAIAFFTQT